MAANQPEENQNPQVQQEVLNHITVGKNLTTGDITVQNYYGTPPPPAPPPLPGIDELVEQVRSLGYNKIKTLHGTMRMLRVNRPIPVDDIYIDLNVLEQVSSDRAFAEWRKEFQPEWRSFDRLGLERVKQERVPALKKVQDCSKLMILGKPGSGKTTLLKSVASACIEGQLQWNSQNYVPVFVTLKDFAEDVCDDRQFNLFESIQQEFRSWGVTDAQVTEAILSQGRALILLDGLDEVPESDSRSVVKQIRRFCQDYYGNRFMITCRTQSQKYRFEGFADVEVADFDPDQVARFVCCWFEVVMGNVESEVLAEDLIQQLERSQNNQIAELAVTPVLLNLTCSMFRDTGSFPANRASLYEKGLRALLEDWDEWKGVERDEVYGNLATEEKEKLLTQVAAVLFEENDYFPEQPKLERLIGEHLKISRTEAGKVLKSIESQHGLLVERSEGFYSFSHLTFQEYFTAKWFVERADWEGLVRYFTKPHWREVFLLATNMLDNADFLMQLMKHQVDALLASDEKLQKLLAWGNQKSCSIDFSCETAGVSYKLSAIRAFYHGLAAKVVHKGSKKDRAYHSSTIFNIANRIDSNFAAHALDDWSKLAIGIDLNPSSNDGIANLAFDHYLIITLVSSFAPCPDYEVTFSFFRCLYRECNHQSELWYRLKELRKQRPSEPENEEWEGWLANLQAWVEKLRVVIIQHRNIGHDWQFSEEQKELLQLYYKANELLLDCLNGSCNVSFQVRSDIEETLLLPIADIEKR